jgi:hypothetical protein
MAGAASELTPLTTDESRRQDRTHLFVAATLYAAGSPSPVHIRNMSPSGALIEGAVLPEQDMAATLRRGCLEAAARIVWKAGRKAGICFSSTLHVADWMSRIVPSHQDHVDEAVRSIRAGQEVEPSHGADRPPALAGPGLEAELRALKGDLAELENGLTADAAVAAGHPEIQLLDVALQRIERMLAGMRNY